MAALWSVISGMNGDHVRVAPAGSPAFQYEFFGLRSIEQAVLGNNSIKGHDPPTGAVNNTPSRAAPGDNRAANGSARSAMKKKLAKSVVGNEPAIERQS
jgi:hypothetical protein